MDYALSNGKWKGAALLGVHAGIAAADAVCSQHLGRRSSSQRHDDAAGLLASVKVEGAHEKAETLSRIVDAKPAAAYDGRPFGAHEAIAMGKRVHRLLVWAAAAVR